MKVEHFSILNGYYTEDEGDILLAQLTILNTYLETIKFEHPYN